MKVVNAEDVPPVCSRQRFHGSPVRYMGTKRPLAPTVRSLILDLEPRGQAVDLFSGMGSVATSLAPAVPVWTNDVLGFTAAFARARFVESQRRSAQEVLRTLLPAYRHCQRVLSDEFSSRIAGERAAIAEGREALAEWIEVTPHAGSSHALMANAQACRRLGTSKAYRLATLYFSGGYFSVRQSIELDALRDAIDRCDGCGNPDWLISAWIASAATVINSPGHTAQFLKPTTEENLRRIKAQWRRSIWSLFVERLQSLQPVGTKAWRSKNRVTVGDALDLVREPAFKNVGVVYADPPYTKDHYSRYYHVYETLYLYDFPASVGAGRYRADRFRTRFSIATEAEQAFTDLVGAVAKSGVPLVLSYPEQSLLSSREVDLVALLSEHLTVTEIVGVRLNHSTLGASSGSSAKEAMEKIYVCKP